MIKFLKTQSGTELVLRCCKLECFHIFVCLPQRNPDENMLQEKDNFESGESSSSSGETSFFVQQSHLKADFSGLSEQGLCCQVGVWVRTPQVCRAARGLNGNLIGGRRSQPWRRVRCWAKSTRVHGWIVKVFNTSNVPLTLHCPTPTRTTTCERTILKQTDTVLSSASYK